MIVIRHTSETGTLVDGTARGDGSAEVLKAEGFRWGRSISCWFRPMSRDHAPDLYRIKRAAEQLRAAGFEVEVEVDATPRGQAEAEADRAARLDDRADALAAKAERKDREATNRLAAAHAISDRIPFGQPILVGHHSERGHRADLKRIENHMNRFCEAYDEAKEAGRAAETAGRHMAHREHPLVVARRIDRLETDLRRTVAVLEGRSVAYGCKTPSSQWREQLEANAAHLREQLEHWRRIHAEQVESGKVGEWTQADVQRGDLVQVRGRWVKVARVNRTTVSVETGYSWTDRVPYHEIREHRRPGADPQPADRAPAQPEPVQDQGPMPAEVQPTQLALTF